MKNVSLVLLIICASSTILSGISVVALAGNESETNMKAERHFIKANELRKIADNDAAIVEYEKVISLSPGSKIARNAQYWVGQSHFQAGRLDAALAAFQTLLDERPASKIATSAKRMIERVQQAKMTESLIEAAKNGDLGQVKLLISKGADVNAVQGKNAWTPLLAAAQGGHAQIARTLLAHGAGIDMGDSYGYTPLYYAIWSDDDETVKVFTSSGADVNKHPPYEGDYSALVYAIWEWRKAPVELVLAAGADLNVKEDEFYTPLYYAAFDSTKDVLDLVLNRGDYPDTIHIAACKGDLEKVKTFIEGGTDVNARDEFGCTPLHWAALADSPAVVNYLIAKGADVNSKNMRSLTPLMNAHALPVVESLIAGGADVNASTNRGRTPLGWAMSKKHDGIVDILRKHGAVETLHRVAVTNNVDEAKRLISLGADVNRKNQRGQTPLHIAANRGHKEMVETLVKNGANVNAKELRSGNTALLNASIRGNKDMVEVLLANGANTEIKDNEGKTPLLEAAVRGHADVVEVLLAHGADTAAEFRGETAIHRAMIMNGKETVRSFLTKELETSRIHVAAYLGGLNQVKDLVYEGFDINTKDIAGFTALFCAACGEERDIVEFLLEKGADANSTTSRGLTALHCAGWNGRKDIAELLLNHGAAVNGKSKQVCTPLYWATHQGHKDMVMFLVSKGAKIQGVNINGETPLHTACLHGYKEIADLLISHGADVNVRTSKGLTPLHWACIEGRLEAVRLLLTKGADINVKGKDGKTPLSIAQEKGHNEIVKLLRKHGAKE